LREENCFSKAILPAVETIEGGNVANQSIPDPAMRSNGASSGTIPMACLTQATHVKKAVRATDENISDLNSAFLAERGCLSPEKSLKHTAA
jgi:hypothetical protein